MLLPFPPLSLAPADDDDDENDAVDAERGTGDDLAMINIKCKKMGMIIIFGREKIGKIRSKTYESIRIDYELNRNLRIILRLERSLGTVASSVVNHAYASSSSSRRGLPPSPIR